MARPSSRPRSICLLRIVLLPFLLPACGPSPEGSSDTREATPPLWDVRTDLGERGDCYLPGNHCCHWSSALSVLLTARGIRLASREGAQWRVPRLRGEHDWVAVREIVEEYVSTSSHSFLNIDVAATPDAHYGDIMAMLQMSSGPSRQVTYVRPSRLSTRIDILPPVALVDGREILIDEARGAFAAGQRMGPWIEYFEGRKVGEGSFVDGLRHGPWTYWREGEKVAEGSYQHGSFEGPWTFWAPDHAQLLGLFGELVKESGDMRKGKRQGLWTTWNEDGNVVTQIAYRGGERSGLCRVWSDGRKWQECL